MKIQVPEHVGELTIEQFQAIHSSTDPVEQVAIACGLPKDVVLSMDLPSMNRVLTAMGDFDPTVDGRWPLINLFEHEGVHYGFHPNLSEVTVGEMADLETLCQDVYANLLPIMSVLYRRVTARHGEQYSVAAYTGLEDVTPLGRVRMEVVMGALAFFFRGAMTSAMSSAHSLMEVGTATS